MSGRAVVVSPAPDNPVGGAERLCADVAGVLGRHGFDVTLVGPRGRGPAWLDRQGGSFLWQAASVRRATHALGQAELVVTCGWLGWPGRAGGRRVHVYVGNLVRLAPDIGGYWHWRARWGAAGGLAEALSARGACAVATSEQAADDARRLYRARIAAVLEPGVDTDLFRPRDRLEARRRLGLAGDGRYALFVGRAEPGKGPGLAVEASRRAGLTLLATGARPVAGAIALGLLSRRELAWAYAAADAVVLPTRYEGFGYVAVESLACGVPIVTTPTGWARKLARDVPEYRPFLVPPDPESVTEALAGVRTAEAETAVELARHHVLAHHTLEAFEKRWTAWLAESGILP
ncbi:MAG TPA: glycosyltransferase family 4 protein [Acidimicrobiales bacterium]|nr:glycosyltransferase family 4 protein [Acidimicrobiales bacterium]